jgi:tetrahydromethanopterin S-methyltransferase subunit F
MRRNTKQQQIIKKNIRLRLGLTQTKNLGFFLGVRLDLLSLSILPPPIGTLSSRSS